MAKALEHWTRSELEDWSELPGGMYGFRAGAGCPDAHLALQRAVAELHTAQPSHTVRLTSLDLSAAFDRLEYAAILDELSERGAPAGLLRLLHSFLTGRWQKVQVGASSSTASSVF